MKLRILASVAAVALLAAPVAAQSGANAPAAAESSPQKGRMMQQLSPAGQEAVKKLFNNPEEAEYQQKLQAQQKKMHDLVGADKLDLAAIRTEMANLNKLTNEHTAQRQKSLLEVLPTLTTADRKALAKIGERRMGQMHGARGDRNRRDWKAHRQGASDQAPQQAAPATK